MGTEFCPKIVGSKKGDFLGHPFGVREIKSRFSSIKTIHHTLPFSIATVYLPAFILVTLVAYLYTVTCNPKLRNPLAIVAVISGDRSFRGARTGPALTFVNKDMATFIVSTQLPVISYLKPLLSLRSSLNISLSILPCLDMAITAFDSRSCFSLAPMLFPTSPCARISCASSGSMFMDVAINESIPNAQAAPIN